MRRVGRIMFKVAFEYRWVFFFFLNCSGRWLRRAIADLDVSSGSLTGELE